MTQPSLGGGRRRRWGRTAAAALLLVLAGSAPLWGRGALAQMDFFHLRRVEIEGARYLDHADVLARLKVDTSASVWLDLAPLERRVATHPQVREVVISRKLPGTLVVRVAENLPVALVPSPAGFRVYDRSGRLLPIDPSRAGVDLPIVPQRDTAVLRLLAEIRDEEPELFGRVSEVRRVGRGGREVVVALDSVPVRAMLDVSARRLADVYPVESDLARRRVSVAELDLRYRDQVIARLQ
jgi:cell division protein FtsQ